TTVSLTFAKLTVDEESCDSQLTWPAIDPATTEEALLGDEISYSGKMKHCFKLSIGTEQYVAKHFFEIGAGKGEVTMAENTSDLEFEALRCGMASWFLRKFRAATADMAITKIRLAQEVISQDGAPSPASGVVKEVYEAAPATDRSIVWLLEPVRNSSVTHYSGTMDHPAGNGQLAHTLSAFVHYSFQESEGGLVFADIQGMCTNSMGIIIFDMMTHTHGGDSGVGDHGPKGIEKWRDQHDCKCSARHLILQWERMMNQSNYEL
ncbi:kinase-like domain-containing protein, partial [Mycena pura]